MDTAALIARLEEQRRHWVDLPGGVRVRFMRPAETEFARFRLGVTVEHVCQYVDGWDGFTQAVVLGPKQGAADVKVPFAPELWAALLRDRADWVEPVAKAIVDAITAHLQAKEAASGN